MSEICVASHHQSVAQLCADAEFLQLARRDGFLVELRMDQYSDLDPDALDKALNLFGPNVVATFRHPAEGGKRSGIPCADRLRYIQHAADRGARFVDVEARTDRGGFRKGNAKLILSYHDFEGVPPAGQLRAQVRSMSAAPDADIIKVAVFPKTIADSLPLLELLRTAARPSIVLGMGEAGFWTRVAGALFGAPFTFGRAENKDGTAPGQPTWRELEELYRFRQIAPGWPVYGVMGNPIAHSLSPLMHNTALRKLDLPGVYLPFKVEGNPAEFVKSFASLGLKGLSVTIPHKEGVMAACAEIDSLARSIGAANTLSLNASGGWSATNTDAWAAAFSLEESAGSLRGKRIVIIGAGGAAKAVAFGVKERGAQVLFMNRTRARAEALAQSVGGEVIGEAELSSRKIDAVVNTTPLGMHPHVDASPLEAEKIPAGGIVFDTVYNPLRTKLLNMAAARGCKTLEGLTMFVEQGARQFELWTGKPAPKAEMKAVVLAALQKRRAKA